MPAKLLVVMGKGGVGKTTLSAALALAAVERGERVGLASLSRREELGEALRVGWGPVPANLELLALDPRAIVDEGVAKLLPVPGLTSLLTAHPAFEAVYRIAPGVKEVAVLHRLLELAGGDLDLLVVDGLATGHGTHFLEAPRKSAHLLAGKLAERARAIDAALTDPARAAVLLATTAEEMPVRETVELASGLRGSGFPLVGIVANRLVPRLFAGPDALAAAELLQDRAAASALASELGAPWSSVRRMARGAVHLERMAREVEGHLATLEGLGLPVTRVPLLPEEEGRLRRVVAALRGAP